MGKIVPLPDCEYRCWVNLNKEELDRAVMYGKVPTHWCVDETTKSYLTRYFKELGYNITW